MERPRLQNGKYSMFLQHGKTCTEQVTKELMEGGEAKEKRETLEESSVKETSEEGEALGGCDDLLVMSVSQWWHSYTLSVHGRTEKPPLRSTMWSCSCL